MDADDGVLTHYNNNEDARLEALAFRCVSYSKMCGVEFADRVSRHHHSTIKRFLIGGMDGGLDIFGLVNNWFYLLNFGIWRRDSPYPSESLSFLLIKYIYL